MVISVNILVLQWPKLIFFRTKVNSRGLGTWPPAFYHKIGNTAHSKVSESTRFTKSYKSTKQQWDGGSTLLDNAFLETPNDEPIHGWPTPLISVETEIALSFIFLCNISFTRNFATLSYGVMLEFILKTLRSNNDFWKFELKSAIRS